MKRYCKVKTLTIALLAFGMSCSITFAQTTATDFNVENCDGEMYHLFAELDLGKVVVIAWVMPCVSCIADPVEAYSIVQNYDPQKVNYFIVDDYADQPCSVIQNWSENYQMGGVTKFSDPAISMSDYGQDGMPKIVVLGCNTHKIFYNENSSSQGIQNAIDMALEECTNTNYTEEQVKPNFSIYPNPVKGQIYLDTPNSTIEHLSIVNSQGTVVIQKQHYHSQKPIDISHLSNGLYIIKTPFVHKSFIVKN
jgi:hypothetical protein